MSSLYPPRHPTRPNRVRRSRLFRRHLAAAGVLVLLSSIGILLLYAWRASVDQQLDANWRRSLGGASVLERYPGVEDNVTVRDLEALGAAIGIDMAPGETPGRVHPAPEAAKRLKAITGQLKAFYTARRYAEDDARVPLPPKLVVFLESARPGLDSIRARLAKGPPPVWKRDLEAGWQTKIPNYVGILTLQKLLLLDAYLQLGAGREARAGEILEASWQLNQSIAANNPVLIPQLIALAVVRLQQPVLRSFPKAPGGWSARLLRLDLQPRILLAFQCENFCAYRTATVDRPVPDFSWGPKAQAVLRWMIWDSARRVSAMLGKLQDQEVRRFDPDAFYREQKASIPRLHIVARAILPNYWNTWPRSAHGELEAELTARILEERERLAAGGPPRSTNRRPSRVDGLSWIYGDIPGGTTLHLDGDLRSQEEKPVPLRFTVHRAAVAIP